MVFLFKDFLGGNELVGDSMSQIWDQDRVAPEPAENHSKQEKPDVPLQKSEYNGLFLEACMNSVTDAEVELPWEQGILKFNFSDGEDDVFHLLLHPCR